MRLMAYAFIYIQIKSQFSLFITNMAELTRIMQTAFAHSCVHGKLENIAEHSSKESNFYLQKKNTMNKQLIDARNS